MRVPIDLLQAKKDREIKRLRKKSGYYDEMERQGTFVARLPYPIEIGDIIKVANEAGIKTVDTAQAYGNCEQRLAPLLNSKFEVVTKVGWEEGKNYYLGSIFNAVWRDWNSYLCDFLRNFCE